LDTLLIDAAGDRNPAKRCDAEDVARQLYTSNQEYSRDHAGRSLRFEIPTVANGRVYVGAKREVDVYGLLPTAKK
jgi:hypothetical protein